jgi:hypothetical protein
MTDIPLYTLADRCPKCAAPVIECSCGNMLTLSEAMEIVTERWSNFTRAEKRAWLAEHKNEPIAVALAKAVQHRKH